MVLGMDGDTWGALVGGIGGVLVFIAAAQPETHSVDGGGDYYAGTTTVRDRLVWACRIVGAGLVVVGALLLLAASSHLAVLGCVLGVAAVLALLWAAAALDLKYDADRVNAVNNGPPRSYGWCLRHVLQARPLTRD